MGDMREEFDALKKYHLAERHKKEPSRREYAIKKLDGIKGIRYLIGEDSFEIYIDKNQIDFWPWNGGFCGRKPIGNIKGRGIDNLVKEIEKMVGKKG